MVWMVVVVAVTLVDAAVVEVESPHQRAPGREMHISLRIGLQRPSLQMHGFENMFAQPSHVMEGVGLSTGEGMGEELGAGTGVGIGVGNCVGDGEPFPGRILISAQFQNCSPQPECPFGPAGPEQLPPNAVHQAAFPPVQ